MHQKRHGRKLGLLVCERNSPDFFHSSNYFKNDIKTAFAFHGHKKFVFTKIV